MDLALLTGELTESRKEAIELHYEIKKNGELAAAALVDFCKGLKKMRDSRLYTEFGYETFEAYAEQEFSLKQRQAYNYIQALEGLGESVLQSNAKLGITKLKILSELPRLESAEFIDENDVDGMSTRELKETIEKLKEKEKQITFLEMQNSELTKSNEELEKDVEESVEIVNERDSLKEQLENKDEEIADLIAELKELRDKPQEVAVREPTAEEIQQAISIEKKKIEAEKSKALKEAADKAHKDRAQAVKAAEDKANAKIAEIEKKYQSAISSVEAEKKQTAARLEELEKNSKVSSNPEVLKFSFYFEECQMNIQKMKEIVSSVDEDTADKLRKAMAAVAENLIL